MFKQNMKNHFEKLLNQRTVNYIDLNAILTNKAQFNWILDVVLDTEALIYFEGKIPPFSISFKSIYAMMISIQFDHFSFE